MGSYCSLLSDGAVDGCHLREEISHEKVFAREANEKTERLQSELTECRLRCEVTLRENSILIDDAKSVAKSTAKAAEDAAVKTAILQQEKENLKLIIAKSAVEKDCQPSYTKVLLDAKASDDAAMTTILQRIPHLEAENNRLKAELAISNRNLELHEAIRAHTTQEYADLKETYRMDTQRFEKDLVASHNALLAREDECRMIRRDLDSKRVVSYSPANFRSPIVSNDVRSRLTGIGASPK